MKNHKWLLRTLEVYKNRNNEEIKSKSNKIVRFRFK
jgi:hypothetical protein